MPQSRHSLSIRTILDMNCLQLIQDAFSSTFRLPCMIIDPDCTPVTEPSNWQAVCDRVNENADIPPDCQRRLADLLITCAEDGLPASSVCPKSGLTTSMVPIFLDETLIGAWVLDQVRFDGDVRAQPDTTAKRPGDARPAPVPPSFTVDKFDLVFDLLVSVNTAVMQLAKTNREMAIRDMQLRGINDQMDATNAMLRKFIDYSHVAMYISDYYTGEILMANRAYCQVVGLDPDTILGKKCYQVNGMGADGFCTFCPRERLLDQNNHPAKPQTWTYFNTRFNLWLRCTNQAIVWSHGRLAQLVTQLDVTQEYRMQEELRHLAFTDRHTGLYNSQKLLQDIKTHQAVCRRNTTRHSGRGSDTARRTRAALDFVCFDLSSLRSVGDAFGSGTAGELLKAILEWFAAKDFGQSTLYRLDADQFCIAVKDGTEEEIGLIATRIAARFTKSWLVRMHGSETAIFVNVYVSILYATRDNLLQGDLLGLMGRTLESARERQRVVVFDEEIDQKTRERLRLETSLIACVKKGMENFEVHFQPIVHLKTGSWKGLEALCRWRDPETGPVPPSVFIPAAERLGLIGTLGLWVLDNAARHAKQWGLDGQDGFFLSINISPLQMMDETFADKVAAVLKRHGLPGHKISLEVTESTEFTFSTFTRSVTRQLQDLGVRLALDDFGTGYSSFNNLKNLPVTFLKTEAAFIRGIETDSYMQYFFYILSELAHANEMQLVAEGVETREQLAIVKKNGADYIQGYLFSKPLPPGDVAGQLHRFRCKEEILADLDQECIDVTRWLDGTSAYALAPNLIRLLNHCLHILLSDAPLDESFRAVLEKAGTHFDLDRTFALLWPAGGIGPAHEWCGKNTGSQRERLARLQRDGIPDSLRAALCRDGMLLSADITTLPGAMLPFLGAEENRALALMPLWNDEELAGAVGFCRALPHAWTPDAVIVLQNLALIMTNCINREMLKTRVMEKCRGILAMTEMQGGADADPGQALFRERRETLVDADDACVALIQVEAEASGGADGVGDCMDRAYSSIRTCIRTDDLLGRVDATRFLGVFPRCPRSVAVTRLDQAAAHFDTVFPGNPVPPFAYGFLDAGLVAELGAGRLLDALREGLVSLELDLFGRSGALS